MESAFGRTCTAICAHTPCQTRSHTLSHTSSRYPSCHYTGSVDQKHSAAAKQPKKTQAQHSDPCVWDMANYHMAKVDQKQLHGPRRPYLTSTERLEFRNVVRVHEVAQRLVCHAVSRINFPEILSPCNQSWYRDTHLRHGTGRRTWQRAQAQAHQGPTCT